MNRIEICNDSLSRVGVSTRIQSLTEKTEEAYQCNLHYLNAVESVLADPKIQWRFAKKTKELGLINETPLGWLYGYQYPSDCLAIRYLDDSAGTYTQLYASGDTSVLNMAGIPFDVCFQNDTDGKMIATNQENAYGVYTARITNEAHFPILFAKAVAARLAIDIAQPFRKDTNLRSGLINEYRLHISLAAETDANEFYATPSDSNSFSRSRQ